MIVFTCKEKIVFTERAAIMKRADGLHPPQTEPYQIFRVQPAAALRVGVLMESCHIVTALMFSSSPGTLPRRVQPAERHR